VFVSDNGTVWNPVSLNNMLDMAAWYHLCGLSCNSACSISIYLVRPSSACQRFFFLKLHNSRQVSGFCSVSFSPDVQFFFFLLFYHLNIYNCLVI
jgi:hypothetical protein